MRRSLFFWLLLFLPLTATTVLPLCGLMFQCGCTLRSGEKYCNVHTREGPHCPWCQAGPKAFLPTYALATAAAGALATATLRRQRPLWMALLLSIVAYLPLMAIGGLTTAKLVHYPTWFGLHVY